MKLDSIVINVQIYCIAIIVTAYSFSFEVPVFNYIKLTVRKEVKVDLLTGTYATTCRSSTRINGLLQEM